MLRLQAEDLKINEIAALEAPKFSFKQKYEEDPDQSLTAESAYEMFHNIFYVSNAPSLKRTEIQKLIEAHSPTQVTDFGSELCAQEVQILSEASETLAGRTILVLVLNQFRSKKV